ncbi:flagellar biosynthesis anti-sigma factor FlgM [Citrobacter amalonaticus]|uniref:Negative regulator of flagellin synthesis n=1 Tax=Citrobacter amalonaticus TaxID=35703 RepID=A0A2S4RRR9_CITAM|nr:flagellar biosynthesis anti-sigma factor FlgM [Citrobacter amalonaticus]POT58756.1 flagellar biosynthesis anti-sigma factor FlgM [Citrobacter amalonaticus]POT70435.1 flagellar biosynthesis anti-sigma factor FlgM [Citrobacter amalonaticus]POU61419.1 flagellar biosynthesis anti-sigma factor FlgM [Citrobacter amalonaticus]POV06279.1 flagellar biosynthesis anti-sigma factor FlgM [Citrobacter amalonaticus]
MKITATMSGNSPAPTASGTNSSNSKSTTSTRAASTPTFSADDITQAGLQSAQQALNDDNQSDIDNDKVARMQAALAAGDLQMDNDQLAGDMLSFFQK